MNLLLEIREKEVQKEIDTMKKEIAKKEETKKEKERKNNVLNAELQKLQIPIVDEVFLFIHSYVIIYHHKKTTKKTKLKRPLHINSHYGNRTT